MTVSRSTAVSAIVVTLCATVVAIDSVIREVTLIVPAMHVALVPVRSVMMAPSLTLVFAPMFFRVIVIVVIVRMVVEVDVGRNCTG
ncbi:MAG: hypothetical protein O7B25_10035 [Gammaproteobacteria bacterium]|nr:hypothetical protein [Gammaproteobacteria bacterium]